MSTASPMLRLDPRRLDQLKAIAAATGTTSTGVIAELIRANIAAGVIGPAIPGVTVTHTPTGVAISLNDNPRTVITHDFARRLAACIRGVVQGTEEPTIFPIEQVAVLRQGTGFKIVVPFPGSGVAFPGDLALDLADLIEGVAK
ncbi:hypothetical protein [Devosia sp. 919]|uniref:hypothetical protein n=1 Tax=Devosia sp. 919 TaxID=2726065 RepID=UPI001553F497|nr:hypothetical protein [Devosia sp. 919]